MFREWICLDHPGFAGQKAQKWWRERFGCKKNTDVMTVDKALGDMWACDALLHWTKTITVKRNGRFYEVVDYNQPLGEEIDG